MMATSEPEKDDLSQPELAEHFPNLRPTMPDHGYMELLWENGQIVAQSVSNKASIPSTCAIEVPEEGNHIATTNGDQMGLVGKGLLQTALPYYSQQTTTNINQEHDEMNPRLDCPADDIYMEFFSEVSGIDLNSLSFTVSANEITDYSQVEGGTHAVENPSTSKDSERYLEGRESLFQEQCQTFMSRSRPKDSSDVTIGANRCGNGDLPIKMQTQDPTSSKHPSSSAPLMNFSHFSRLAAQVDSNFQFMDGMSNSETACAPARGGSMGGPNSDHSANEMRKAPALFHGQMPPSARSKQDLKLLPAQHAKMAVSFQNSEPICWEEDDARNASKHNDKSTDSTANLRMPAGNVSGHGSSFQGRHSVAGKNRSEKPVTTSPSMCSANIVAGASPKDIKSKAKRKTQEGEASEYRAEDCGEDDSASTRKPIPRKSTGTKRSRAVGLHSFSERRRWDRINEKIRALRRLIPNCSKVDKASTLNEAIEYLRALQMQLQIMSMYGGLHMMPVMVPSGTPPMGMGFNMGMGSGLGFGMGMLEMAGPSMLPMPHMQGPVLHHPYATNAPHAGTNASTNLQMFGQGSSPMSIPHPTTTMAPSAPVSKKVNHAPQVPEQALDSALPSPEDGAAADHRPTRW